MRDLDSREPRGRERRVFERRRIELEAECRLGGSVLAGRVLDESVGGVFFALEPVVEDTRLPYDPEVGDFLVLDRGGERAVAVIRWRGHSGEHAREGLGLELAEL